MKKVLFILPYLGIGGAEIIVYELIRNLSPDKFSSKVICYKSKTDSSIEKKIESICEVDYMKITGKITPLHMIRVMRKITDYSPDIVHVHLGGVTFAIPWCWLHKKPLVLTVHTTPDKAFSLKNQNQIRRFLNSGLLTIVAVSRENYELVKNYYNIDDSRVQFVNNGIDLDRYYRKQHDIFSFINVSRQTETKNQKTIIRAFSRLCETECKSRLYLVGDGPCHNDLLEQKKILGLDEKIIMPGVSGMPEFYYAISDVYVQSSHREALPLSVLEGMAAGLPIISTDVGGLKDVVKQNGLLVPDDDEDALYEAMKKMIKSKKEDLDLMGSISKTIAEDYSSKKMACRYEQLYTNINKDR